MFRQVKCIHKVYLVVLSAFILYMPYFAAFNRITL